MTWRAAIPLIALAATGCTWGEPGVIVTGVDPSTIVSGSAALLTVTAEGLDLAGTVDFDDPERSALCEGVWVELRASDGQIVPLEDVVRLSATELRGRIGAWAPRDTFDVEIVAAGGRTASLPAALESLKCLPPNAPCDDGNPCTENDRCGGVDRCTPGTEVLDGTPCTPLCPVGGGEGTCSLGICVPTLGACSAPSSCTAP